MAKVYSWLLNSEDISGQEVYGYIKNPYEMDKDSVYIGSALCGTGLTVVQDWAKECSEEEYKTQFNILKSKAAESGVTFENVENYLDVDTCDNLRGPKGRGIKSIYLNNEGDTYDTYAMVYDDGVVDYFTIPHGKDGKDGKDGAKADDPILYAFKTVYASGVYENGELKAPEKLSVDNTFYDFAEQVLTIPSNSGWYISNSGLTPPIFSSSREFYSSRKTVSWSEPMQITGDDGKPGTDGITTEFIYCLTSADNLTEVKNSETKVYKEYVEWYEWNGKYILVTEPQIASNLYAEGFELPSTPPQGTSYFKLFVIPQDLTEDNVNIENNITEVVLKTENTKYIKNQTSQGTKYFIWGEYKSEYIPVGWTDSPQGVDEEHKIEWCATRKRNLKTLKWGDWTKPSIWSKYGEKGEDGDGVEYIFIYTDGTMPENPTPLDYETNTSYQSRENEWVPPIEESYESIDHKTLKFTKDYCWSDDTIDVSPEKQYIWTASRKYRKTISKYEKTETLSNVEKEFAINVNTVPEEKIGYIIRVVEGEVENYYKWKEGPYKWGAFSKPSLWAHYGENGKSGIVIRELFTLTTNTSQEPTLPGDSIYTSWSVGFPVEYQAGVNVVWGTRAEIYADSHEFVVGYNLELNVEDSVTGINTIEYEGNIQELKNKYENDDIKYLKQGNSYYYWDESSTQYVLYSRTDSNNNTIYLPKDSLYEINTLFLSSTEALPEQEKKDYVYLKKNDVYYVWDDNDKCYKEILEPTTPKVNEINTIYYDKLPDKKVYNYKYLIYKNEIYTWKQASWSKPYLVTGLKGDKADAINYNTDYYVYHPDSYTPNKPINTKITDDKIISNDKINTSLEWVWQTSPILTRTPIDNYTWYKAVGSVVGDTQEVTWSEPTLLNGRDGKDGINGKIIERRYCVTLTASKPTRQESDREPRVEYDKLRGWFLIDDARLQNLLIDGSVPTEGALWEIQAEINPQDNTLASNWSSPIRINGEQGGRGPEGPAGRRGATGIPGATLDVLYCLGTHEDKFGKYIECESGDSSNNTTTIIVNTLPTVKQDCDYIKFGDKYYKWEELTPGYFFEDTIVNGKVEPLGYGYFGDKVIMSGNNISLKNWYKTPPPTDMIHVDNEDDLNDSIKYGNLGRVVDYKKVDRINSNQSTFTNITHDYYVVYETNELSGKTYETNSSVTASENVVYICDKFDSFNNLNKKLIGKFKFIKTNEYYSWNKEQNKYVKTTDIANNSKIKNVVEIPEIEATGFDYIKLETHYQWDSIEKEYELYNPPYNAGNWKVDKKLIKGNVTAGSDSDTTNVDFTPYLYCIQGPSTTGYEKIYEYRSINKPNDIIDVNYYYVNNNSIPYQKDLRFKYYNIQQYCYVWDNTGGGYSLISHIVNYKPADAITISDVTGGTVSENVIEYTLNNENGGLIGYALNEIPTFQLSKCEFIKKLNDYNSFVYYKWINGEYNSCTTKPETASSDNTVVLTKGSDISLIKKEIKNFKYIKSEINENDSKSYVYYGWDDIPNEELKQEVTNVAWCEPFKLQGSNGLTTAGNRGQVVYPMGVYNANNVYVTTTAKAPYVMDPQDSLFYVYNVVDQPWVGVLPENYKTIMEDPVDANKLNTCETYSNTGNTPAWYDKNYQFVKISTYYVWNNDSGSYQKISIDLPTGNTKYVTNNPTGITDKDSDYLIYNGICYKWDNNKYVNSSIPSDATIGNTSTLIGTSVPTKQQGGKRYLKLYNNYLWKAKGNSGEYIPTAIIDSSTSNTIEVYYKPTKKIGYKYFKINGGYYTFNNSNNKYEVASTYKYKDSRGEWMISQSGDTPATNYANAVENDIKPAWVRFEYFDAIYASVGIIANGMIGSAVYNNEFMFSQQGKKLDENGERVYGTNYEDFLSAYFFDENENNGKGAWTLDGKKISDTSLNPYHDGNKFWPNVCINFKTGQMWLSCGQITFGATGGDNGDSESTNLVRADYINEWGNDDILSPQERSALRDEKERIINEYEQLKSMSGISKTAFGTYEEKYYKAISALDYHSKKSNTTKITDKILPTDKILSEENEGYADVVKFGEKYYIWTTGNISISRYKKIDNPDDDDKQTAVKYTTVPVNNNEKNDIIQVDDAYYEWITETVSGYYKTINNSGHTYYTSDENMKICYDDSCSYEYINEYYSAHSEFISDINSLLDDNVKNAQVDADQAIERLGNIASDNKIAYEEIPLLYEDWDNILRKYQTNKEACKNLSGVTTSFLKDALIKDNNEGNKEVINKMTYAQVFDKFYITPKENAINAIQHHITKCEENCKNKIYYCDIEITKDADNKEYDKYGTTDYRWINVFFSRNATLETILYKANKLYTESYSDKSVATLDYLKNTFNTVTNFDGAVLSQHLGIMNNSGNVVTVLNSNTGDTYEYNGNKIVFASGIPPCDSENVIFDIYHDKVNDIYKYIPTNIEGNLMFKCEEVITGSTNTDNTSNTGITYNYIPDGTYQTGYTAETTTELPKNIVNVAEKAASYIKFNKFIYRWGKPGKYRLIRKIRETNWDEKEENAYSGFTTVKGDVIETGLIFNINNYKPLKKIKCISRFASANYYYIYEWEDSNNPYEYLMFYILNSEYQIMQVTSIAPPLHIVGTDGNISFKDNNSGKVTYSKYKLASTIITENGDLINKKIVTDNIEVNGEDTNIETNNIEISNNDVTIRLTTDKIELSGKSAIKSPITHITRSETNGNGDDGGLLYFPGGNSYRNGNDPTIYTLKNDKEDNNTKKVVLATLHNCPSITTSDGNKAYIVIPNIQIYSDVRRYHRGYWTPVGQLYLKYKTQEGDDEISKIKVLAEQTQPLSWVEWNWASLNIHYTGGVVTIDDFKSGSTVELCCSYCIMLPTYGTWLQHDCAYFSLWTTVNGIDYNYNYTPSGGTETNKSGNTSQLLYDVSPSGNFVEIGSNGIYLKFGKKVFTFSDNGFTKSE